MAPISWHKTQDTESFFYLDDNDYHYVKLLPLGKSAVVLKAPYLRRSYQSKRPVGEIITEAFPKTVLLAVVSIVFALIVGIIIGIFCALYKGTWFDHVALVFSTLGMSVPSFFAAILLAWIFAFLLNLSPGPATVRHLSGKSALTLAHFSCRQGTSRGGPFLSPPDRVPDDSSPSNGYTLSY